MSEGFEAHFLTEMLFTLLPSSFTHTQSQEVLHTIITLLHDLKNIFSRKIAKLMV